MILSLPPGPARDARNAAFAETLTSDGELEDEKLSHTWHEYARSYNYDTLEAVDDWWTKVRAFVLLGLLKAYLEPIVGIQGDGYRMIFRVLQPLLMCP